jgi:hypothetical protein
MLSSTWFGSHAQEYWSGPSQLTITLSWHFRRFGFCFQKNELAAQTGCLQVLSLVLELLHIISFAIYREVLTF